MFIWVTRKGSLENVNTGTISSSQSIAIKQMQDRDERIPQKQGEHQLQRRCEQSKLIVIRSAGAGPPIQSCSRNQAFRFIPPALVLRHRSPYYDSYSLCFDPSLLSLQHLTHARHWTNAPPLPVICVVPVTPSARSSALSPFQRACCCP